MRKHHARGGASASEPRMVEARGKGTRRKQLALALCVSLWTAGGSVASANSGGITQWDSIYIGNNGTLNDNVVVYDTDISNGVHVYGAWSNETNQTATNNQVTIDGNVNLSNNKNVGGAFLGGEGSHADGNFVIIKSGTISTVYGGLASGNNGATANDNHVTVNGGTITDEVDGGYLADDGTGNVTGNTVTISGNSTIGGAVFGGFTHNGNAGGESDDPTDPYKNGNKVTITGGTVNDWIVGGYTKAGGSASFNLVEIGQAEDATPTIVNGSNIFGGQSRGTGDASNNTVKISGGTINADIYGSFSPNGNAMNNKVELTGGKAIGWICGGESGGGKADGNEVTIEDNAIFTAADIWGGKGASASNNIVTIKGGTFTGADESLNIRGGSAISGEAKDNIVKISKEDFQVGRISVGEGTSHSGNRLVLDAVGVVAAATGTRDGSVQADIIELGPSVGFDPAKTIITANDFIVDTLDVSAANFSGTGTMTLLQSGTADDLSGLKLAYDAATQKTPVTLTAEGVACNTRELVDGSPKKFYSNENIAALTDENKAVTYTVGTPHIALTDRTGTAGAVTLYAQPSASDAEAGYTVNNNNLRLADGFKALTVADGTWDKLNTIYAGYSKTDDISGYSLSVTGGTVFAVYGAHSEAKNGEAEVSGNTVNITGGTITSGGEIMGARLGPGRAAGNTVNISGGTFGKETGIYGVFANGTISNNTVDISGNTVNISGGTFDTVGIHAVEINMNTKRISDDQLPRLQNNAVWLSGTTRGLETSSLCGANNGGDGKRFITGGNTLNIGTVTTEDAPGAAWQGKSLSGTAENRVSGVTGFDVIKLNTVGWNESLPALEATKGVTYKDPVKPGDSGSPFTLDLTDLSFTGTAPKAGDTMTLLSSGTGGLDGFYLKYDAGDPVKLSSKAGKTSEIVKTAPLTTGLTNGAAVTTGLAHTVSLDTADNYRKVFYTAADDGKATGIDLSAWDGSKAAVSLADYTGTKVPVSTGAFDAPEADATILTAATEDFFGTVTGDRAYAEAAFTPIKGEGVTLSGDRIGGVKAEGKTLKYYAESWKVKDVVLGAVTYEKGATILDGSGATYNYAGVSALDTSGLALTIADPESVKAGDSTTFLKANSTLKDMAAQTAKDVAYSVSPVAGAAVSAAVRGSVSARGGSVVYTVTENKASKLTFTNVNWLDTGALIDHKTTLTNISFEGAEVDTAKISFTNLQTLDTDSKMTLVSGFGTSAGAINGSAFTVGKGTGEGHAYLESSDLRYVVTRGVSDDPTPPEDDNAIDEGGAPVSGKVDGDVTGGVAKNKGVAERNVKEVLPGAEITGSVTAAISDKGTAAENEAKVTGATVGGSVTAAQSESGTATENRATVTGGSVGGSVTAAQSESGTVTENRATVTGGSVGGSVTGAVTGSGVATGNTADISGGCIVGNAEENAARVAGASTVDGTASGNHATISGSTVYGSVYGGVSQSGEVNANTATITGGMVTGDVAGGSTKQESPADNNTVTLEGQATISGNVFGGYSEQGSAAGNEVTVADATVEGAVYGGKSEKASEGNSVTMRGGTVNKLVGGGCETATGNIVTVTGGTVENIFGAEAGTGAEDNAVLLGGGTVGKAVYGGYAESGTTRNNSVTLYGDADVSGANLFGGSLEATGNVLYVGLKDADVTKSSAWTGGAVKNLANFETIRFDVVKWDTETAALTIADGTASDLSQTTVDAAKVRFTDAESLKVNDTMTLLEDSAVEASKRVQEANLTKDSAFTVGTTAQGTGTLSLDGDGNVIYTVKDVTSGEKAHSAVMGLEAGMAALSVGNDFIGDATAGLGLPANEGADGVSTFAKLGGGKLRQTTGSHVDVNTWNAIIAIGKKNVKESKAEERDESQGDSSRITNSKSLRSQEFVIGAFFEYGSGNYTTHNGNERGDGSARYTGGGLLAKWTASHGFYVEGSLRAGTVKDDAKNVLRDGAGVPYSYDTSAGYFGAHIGVGREIGLKGGNTVDVYGKYFYNRRNGVSFDAGGHYDLDAITSSVLRVGARYTMRREAWNFYGELAYEYEMDGEAKGVAGGLAIRGADIGGGSARLELGATMTPAKSPWTLDLNLTGFAGKKRGLMGGISVGFMF